MPDPQAVNSMFARIARRYDVANRMISGGIDLWWRKKLVHQVARTHPHDVVDLATGSGDVAFALARRLPPNVDILGVDFCEPMLHEAELKKNEKGGMDNVRFQVGDALDLPLEPECCDALTISFGLRNLADRARALSEMLRVLRPGGHVFILEFSQPYRVFRPVYLFYLRNILPLFAGWITGDRSAYQYLNSTIENFPGRPALSAELSAAGFQGVQAYPLTLGIVAPHRARKS